MTGYRCAADRRTGMPGLTDRRHVLHESVPTTVNDSCRQASSGGRPREAVVKTSSALAAEYESHKAVTEAFAPQSSQQRLTPESPRQHLCSPSQVSQSSQPQENRLAGNDTAEGSYALRELNLRPTVCATACTELVAHGRSTPDPDALHAPVQHLPTAECTQVRSGC